MAVGDVWGNSWLSSWGNSWAQSVTPVVTTEPGKGWPRKNRKQRRAESREEAERAKREAEQRFQGISWEVAQAAQAKRLQEAEKPAASPVEAPEPEIILGSDEDYGLRILAHLEAEYAAKQAIAKAMRDEEFMVVTMIAALV